jgi:chorismate-pyruvate lyase
MSESAAVPGLVAIEAFADPRTRMLLSNNGSTTRLLEAALHTRVSVQVHLQSPRLAARLPERVRHALRLGEDHYVTIRDSTLFTGDRRPISRTYVVISGSGDRVQSLAVGRDEPLGLALIGASIEQHRTILATGHHPWPYGTPSCQAASKTYVIASDGRPRLHLHEIYNPDLFPAHLRDTTTPEVR